VVGVDQAGEAASEGLTRLRAAAAAVADLDGPADEPGEAGSNPGTGPGSDAGFDATVHADRFSELHDALVTVLADVDRG
jgi:hypothetical protein